MLSESLKNNSKIVLLIKAKYDVVEPHYMEGTTPDHLTAFVGEPECERRPR